mgnify:FL=1
MRKIGLFNIGRLGLVKSAGTGKTDINKMIEKWIPKHMVFWYDMSKPVDVYTQNFNDWQNYNPNSVSITNNKIVVNGLIDNFRIASIGKETESFSVFIEGLGDKNLVYRVKLDENSDQITNIKLKDGKNVLPHSFATTVTFMGASGVTDYIGLTITQLPSGQSVSTNEILKANPYLQDFSGNNRPLKLNNFLFAAMSGVGGYELNWTDQSIWSKFLGNRFNGAIEPHKITVTSVLCSYNIMETKVPSYAKKFKVRIDGIVDETVAYKYINASGTLVSFDIKEDGEYELPSNNTVEGNYNMGWAILVNSYPHTCNITIEQIPSYPNALVTDGVDDYGQVQNLQQGVKVLFVTINPFIDGKFIYDQRLNTTEPWLFAVFNDKGSIAYNSRNSNGKTYIDGTLNESTIVSALLNKKQIITIVNNDVTGDKTKTPVFFSNTDHNSGWISSAFYNSIGFDSVPTKETDGFTEQDLIDYYIPKAIVTITVVDVSGSPIQDATVTVGGVQYKTLSDGTVKVRGMANGTMSLSVKKDGYMPFSNNSWKLADSRITLEVLRNTVITENGYSILLENNGLILTE